MNDKFVEIENKEIFRDRWKIPGQVGCIANGAVKSFTMEVVGRDVH
jgi:hypothetical protein